MLNVRNFVLFIFLLFFKVVKCAFGEQTTDVTITGSKEDIEVARTMIEEAVSGSSGEVLVIK